MDERSPPRCLAVVRENGADVVVFDAHGKPRTFTYKGDPAKLCFSTHGTVGADDLLTPCFDEDGLHLHDLPDEGCFCGDDRPHIHAHLHDPRLGCASSTSSSSVGGCQGKHEKKPQDVTYLAKLALYPCDTLGDEGSVPSMHVSSSLPNECNSQQVKKRFGGNALGYKVGKIIHDDHEDNLVYNDETKQLHLQHDCNDCGEKDIHGKFDLVATRNLEGNVPVHFYSSSSEPFTLLESIANLFEPVSDRVRAAVQLPVKSTCCQDPTCKAKLVGSTVPCTSRQPPTSTCCTEGASCSAAEKISCSAPSAGPTKSSCCAPSGSAPSAAPTKSSCCAPPGSAPSAAPTKSSCCAPSSSAPPAAPTKSSCCAEGTSCSTSSAGQSTKSSCCAAGTPGCSKPGCCADGTSCSAPAKPDCCVGGDCNNASKYHCCMNGTCTAVLMDLPPPPTGKQVRSTFLCSKLCCSKETRKINTILEPTVGVSDIHIQVPVKEVIVDHDPSLVTANDIRKLLNLNNLGALVAQDGAAINVPSTTVGRSTLFCHNVCCSSEIPQINAILNPMKGIVKVSVNPTTKLVYVDHDTAIISAVDISTALDKMGAELRKDAQTDLLAAAAAASRSFLRSTLTFSGPCPDVGMLTTYLEQFESNEIQSFVVDEPGALIHVVHNPIAMPAEHLSTCLTQDFGIETNISIDGAADTEWEFPEMTVAELPADPAVNKNLYPRPTVLLSGFFWVVSMFSLIGGNWEYLKYLALISVAFGLPPILVKAFKTLRGCHFDTNVLMSSAVFGALALQEFTEAAAVTFLFSLSEWLESRATARAKNALSEIVNLRPEKANLIHPSSKEIIEIPAAAVPLGARVSVKPGDKIPCDGVVVTGTSTVNESSLTGESRPCRKGPKDKVYGGTINSGLMELVVRTIASAEDSAVARLIRLVEEAQANRSPTEKMVDELARYYTPVVILAAIMMCTIPWAFGRETGRFWTNNGLVLIVVACPCALIISTPVTYVAGLAATAQRGILIKGGAHLETLGKVELIAMDKTGTVTQGNFALLKLETIGESLTRLQMLEFLYLMEERAHHPLAQAIVQGVKNEGAVPPKTRIARDHTNLAGEGVQAIVDDLAIYVGNERLFKRLELYEKLPQSVKDEAKRWAECGGTVGFMSVGRHGIVAAYSVADAIRPEAKDSISALRKHGIGVRILTGDNSEAAHIVGKQVGLEVANIHSQLFPEDKLRIVEEMKTSLSSGGSCKKRPTTLFCGDGVNDAPALAVADVGVAMGAGAALAMETSDVTLLDSNLEKLVYSIEMGKRVSRKIIENIAFSFIVKAIVLGFTLSGEVHLWAAIASDVGAMICVTLNGMMLLPYKKRSVQLENGDNMEEQSEDSIEVGQT